jgi:hypothetical protein
MSSTESRPGTLSRQARFGRAGDTDKGGPAHSTKWVFGFSTSSVTLSVSKAESHSRGGNARRLTWDGRLHHIPSLSMGFSGRDGVDQSIPVKIRLPQRPSSKPAWDFLEPFDTAVSYRHRGSSTHLSIIRISEILRSVLNTRQRVQRGPPSAFNTTDDSQASGEHFPRPACGHWPVFVHELSFSTHESLVYCVLSMRTRGTLSSLHFDMLAEYERVLWYT